MNINEISSHSYIQTRQKVIDTPKTNKTSTEYQLKIINIMRREIE